MFDFPAVEAGLSSAAAGGSGLALSERSESSQTPSDASSVRNRAAALTSAAGPRPGLVAYKQDIKKSELK